MARKVFISVLGTNHYLETRYYLGKEPEGNEKVTRFIQETTMEHLCHNWSSDSSAYIFVTKEAKVNNWNDPAQIKHKDGPYQGLSKIIENLNLKFPTEAVPIPEGMSENEIWEIFEIVYKKIQDGDELYFDITHSFRSIPMLVMVLINYVKFLKNTTVKKIYYGAFEKLGYSYVVKNIPVKDRFAPVLDLTAFSALQDWTNATNLFLTHGNMDALAQLTKSEVTPILKATQGKDKDASDFRNISGTMTAISTALKTNNAPDIIKATIFADFKKQLTGLNKDMIKPLSPVLDKINEKISHFSVSEDVMNGLKAVDFCIESGLIQQAYTMLQESIISLVLDSEKLNMKNDKLRNIASGAFKIKKENFPFEQWNPANANNRELTETFLNNPLIEELVSVFNALTDKRNIINHAGFNEKSSTKVFNNLEKDIKELNQRVKEKLNI